MTTLTLDTIRDVPLPLSNTQVDRLGERLRSTDPPSRADLVLLQQLRETYVGPTEAVQSRLRELGIERTTSRVKTDKTIIEKLRRGSTRLSTMQDIGGVRMWREMDLTQEDRTAMDIAAAFPGSRIDDLRNEPHFGYRAVHVIVRQDGLRIEVQVRTRLQQLWAETMEKFADAWGRGLRYGAKVSFSVEGQTLPEDQDPLALLRRSSEMIAELEGNKTRYYVLFDREREAWLNTSETMPIPGPALGESRQLHDRLRRSVEDLLGHLAELPANVQSKEEEE